MKKVFIPFSFLMIMIFIGCNPDKKEWQKAKSINSISAYENFVNQFPNSSFVDSAYFKIDKIRFEKAATVNSIQIFQKFIEDYPESAFLDSAKNKLENIFPSFKRDLLFEINSISPLVLDGSIEFKKGSTDNFIKVIVNGKIKGENYPCFCFRNVKIDSNVKVPLDIFYKDIINHPIMNTTIRSGKLISNFKVENGVIKQPIEITYYEYDNMVAEFKIKETCSEFIISGDSTVNLIKENNGFRLIDGKVNFLKEDENN
ncbi:tol-pal system YbgF family protein [Bacteroidota bacterium]